MLHLLKRWGCKDEMEKRTKPKANLRHIWNLRHGFGIPTKSDTLASFSTRLNSAKKPAGAATRGTSAGAAGLEHRVPRPRAKIRAARLSE